MKKCDVKNLKISKKYANALFESANEKSCTQKVYDDLVFVDETVNTNEQLKDFLFSPIIKPEDKKDVINKLFSIHIDKNTLDFLYILIDNSRLYTLDEILNQYSYKLNESNNIVKPTVISAVELNEDQKNSLTVKLENKLGKKIISDYIIDEEIIGGIIVEIDDKTIDCSLKTKFDNMKKQLTKGN